MQEFQYFLFFVLYISYDSFLSSVQLCLLYSANYLFWTQILTYFFSFLFVIFYRLYTVEQQLSKVKVMR